MSRSDRRKAERIVKNIANTGKKAMENFVADRQGIVTEDMLIGFKAGYIAGLNKINSLEEK